MKKKAIVLFAVLCLALMSFTACSSDGSNNNSATDDRANTTSDSPKSTGDVINDIGNDIEKGADDVKKGVDDIGEDIKDDVTGSKDPSATDKGNTNGTGTTESPAATKK